MVANNNRSVPSELAPFSRKSSTANQPYVRSILHEGTISKGLEDVKRSMEGAFRAKRRAWHVRIVHAFPCTHSECTQSACLRSKHLSLRCVDRYVLMMSGFWKTSNKFETVPLETPSLKLFNNVTRARKRSRVYTLRKKIRLLLRDANGGTTPVRIREEFRTKKYASDRDREKIN